MNGKPRTDLIQLITGTNRSRVTPQERPVLEGGAGPVGQGDAYATSLRMCSASTSLINVW